MAGSQLKRLKASLRDQGIVGPQKSKKQKKKAAEEARANGSQDKRLRRSAALETIREQFNPFQFKMSARGPKFPVTSLKAQKEGLRGIQGRPAESMSKSEERRRNTLLVDYQRRNKVGGILDRRLGEGDPDMTPEERALERFTFEKQRIHSKKGAMFDLEDDFGDGEGLTHMGQSLAVDDGDEVRDDFDDSDLGNLEDDDDGPDMSLKKLKRLRSELLEDEDGDEDDAQGREAGREDGAPERKKTKMEVMKELIAKSKFHKHERQLEREADEDERAELDKMLPELQELLFAQKAGSKGSAEAKAERSGDGDRSLPVDKAALGKNYDVRLKQMLQDQKAEPSTRTKTEEEQAAEQSEHLQKLEESRLRRMRGEIEYDQEEEAEEEDKKEGQEEPLFSFPGQENEDEFKLGQGIKVRHTAAELGFDDEDDFLIDDDLVASASEAEPEDEDAFSESEDGEAAAEDDDEDDEDDEFTKGLLTEEEKKNPAFAKARAAGAKDDDGVPFTFPCPQTHAELLAVVADVPLEKLATVVQRIRALYHPKLDHGNKERLGRFAGALVAHLAYLGSSSSSSDSPTAARYAALESLVRHVHSLAKTVPIAVAAAFRGQLAAMEASGARAVALTGGDLAVLTAVTLFPTSDHFHQVVTPAMLAMGRALEQKRARSLADHAAGLYVCALFLQFQQRSQRYVPELVGFAVSTALALAPVALDERSGSSGLAQQLPVRTAAAAELRIRAARKVAVRRLRPGDWTKENENGNDGTLPVALLAAAVDILAEAAALWADKAALPETLAPVQTVLRHLQTPSCRRELPKALSERIQAASAAIDGRVQAAQLARRPLALHNHRPLAIRTFVPRFEDEFDPSKHYDADRERAETAKLQAEYKRERKGALRELRKDAAFLAREKLKVKKARDAAYDKKYRRIVAEIQGSEGREANAYERERQQRKRQRR